MALEVTLFVALVNSLPLAVCLFVFKESTSRKYFCIYTKMGDTTKDFCSISSLVWPGSCPCLDTSL